MKSTILLAACLFAAGCSLPGDWSHAGLDYDIETGTFSGMPETTLAQTPTSGAATFTGEYRSLSRANPFGKGDATLQVDFDTSNVQLDLAGTVTGSATGTLYGPIFFGSGAFNFSGRFYGDTASVAAGNFDTADTTGQFITQR